MRPCCSRGRPGRARPDRIVLLLFAAVIALRGGASDAAAAPAPTAPAADLATTATTTTQPSTTQPATPPAPAAPPAPAPPARETLFRDPEDGAFDVSNFLSTRVGFLPLAMPITEPAVGYGFALGLSFFHDEPQVVTYPGAGGAPRVRRETSGRCCPTTATGKAGVSIGPIEDVTARTRWPRA